jgi:hypothetical protein
MRAKRPLAPLGLAAIGLGVACAGARSQQVAPDGGGPDSPKTTSDAGGHDDAPARGRDAAPPDAGRDHGKPSRVYPAFTPFMPAVRYNGGPVLRHPRIVTVSWRSDPSHADWESFDDAIGASAYWTSTTAEYGVGAAAGGSSSHVELTTTDPKWTDDDITSFVVSAVSDPATSGWPAPTSDSLYAIYLPPATAASLVLRGQGSACSGATVIGGYHDDVSVPGVGDVAYAVVIACPGLTQAQVTAYASHELVEGATDPEPSDRLAYSGIEGSGRLAWDYLQVRAGTEVADMCEPYPDSVYFDEALGWEVQRIWSNRSAAAGHAPCVPAKKGAYNNVTPLDQESITVDATPFLGSERMPALGYSVPVGTTKTFRVGFYSDGPTSGPWAIQAIDLGDPYAGLFFQPTHLSSVTLTMDLSRGQNGEIAYVTATMNSVDQTDSDLVVIQSYPVGDECSDLLSCVHYMPILLSARAP